MFDFAAHLQPLSLGVKLRRLRHVIAYKKQVDRRNERIQQVGGRLEGVKAQRADDELFFAGNRRLRCGELGQAEVRRSQRRASQESLSEKITSRDAVR